MFFVIIALGMSAVQILIGIAIGLSLRRHRQRQLADSDASQLAVDALDLPNGSGAADKVDRAVNPVSRSDVAAAAKAGERGGACTNAVEPTLPSGSDRRTSLRQCFEFRQNIAPYFGKVLPGRASFHEVECHDISSTGFSFLSSQLPDFESIVVALGVAPHLVYLRAQIVNRFQIDDHPAPLYRIGCRFIGQVN